MKYDITREHMDAGLTESQWDSVIGCAMQFSANVCKSLNNYVDKEFANNLKQ
jgi:fructokinase